MVSGKGRGGKEEEMQILLTPIQKKFFSFCIYSLRSLKVGEPLLA